MTRVLGMRWDRLAFLHWPVPAEPLRARIPEPLDVDTFDGTAWVGVVPFEMQRVRFRGLPPLPGARRFLELNLRTYVTLDGRPGVWFFSLDAESWTSVRGARATFALPYFDARMSMHDAGDGGTDYRSERRHRGAPPARFDATYRPVGEFTRSAPGGLTHFLTERYSLYAQRGFGVRHSLRGGLVRGDIEHPPWELAPAEVALRECEMFALGGVRPGGEPFDGRGSAAVDDGSPLPAPLAHVARPVDVRAHAPRRARG
ncbi:MAG: DUF2071 domain-containing protein [Planctomycetota bacterium]